MGRQARQLASHGSLRALARVFLLVSTAMTGMHADYSHAYTPTLTSSGKRVSWRGDFRFNLAGNPINASGLPAQSFRDAVVHGLQRWNYASGGTAKFDYWQGTDPGTYEPNSSYNGLSSVYFASNQHGDGFIPSNVLGLTQVWYNTDSGEILEADIVLNDKDFRFTSDPRDTSGFGNGGSGALPGKSAVYIENVITHELGHALGLSHSGGLQSTMLFMESPEQARLSCDEIAAIRSTYPGATATARGTLAGAVVAESGAPLFGAHVLAISRRRGTVMATGMTDRSGRYEISGLEPGQYVVMAEPFFAGAPALPSYYSEISSAVCPGRQPFGRTMLMEDGNRARLIEVGTGGAAQAPVLTVHCGTPSGGAVVAASSVSPDGASSAPVIFDGRGGGFAAADRFTSSGSIQYKLRSLSGRVEIHALSYSLYSPVAPALSLTGPNGERVKLDENLQGVYKNSASGFVNHDALLVASSLSPGDYTLKVTYQAMEPSLYPAGSMMLDAVPFLVITGSVNEGEPVAAGEVAVNARCTFDDSKLGAYTSPPGGPPRHQTEEDKGGGFCGTINLRVRGGGESDRGEPPSMGLCAIAGFFLPWLLMLGIARLSRRRQRPVSSMI